MISLPAFNDEHVLEYGGSFRLLRKIAAGGMATVYEAEQLGPAGFTKRLALKVIQPQYAGSNQWRRAFVEEAKLSANLVHGNIVQIYQLGESNGQLYIAMEFIQGPTLRAVIDRQRELGIRLPAALAAYIASRVCRALDFAHNFIGPDGKRLDIVHRDVSPGNVMLTWDGHVKLADFGVAKANTSSATLDQLVGKKNYISPEQFLALEVDGRSDVFALGVVLFELLSEQPLFLEAVTELALDEVTRKPIPGVRTVVPDVPRQVEQILAMALEREPERRPTAAALGQMLDAWVESQPIVATPDRLQEHLARIFPRDYRPRSRTEELTIFSGLLGARRRSWWRRLIARAG